MTVRNFSLTALPVTRSVWGTSRQVVFCDFDGPIVDVSERYYQTYLKGLLAVEQLYEEQLIKHYQEPKIRPKARAEALSKADFWELKQNRTADIEIMLRSGLASELHQPFMQQIERMVNHPSLLRLDRVQPSAQAALHYMKGNGLRLVLVTLRHPRQVEDFLQAHQLAHLIDQVYGVADINAAQANRVEQKCKLLATAIAQQTDQGHRVTGSWMIGDTEADILAGQAMNLSTAALSCGIRSAAYLKALQPSKLYGGLMSAAGEVVTSAMLQAA